MKQPKTTLLLTLFISMITVEVFAYHCQIDNICYNVDFSNRTASVTYSGYPYNNEYTGHYHGGIRGLDIQIPSTIIYNNEEYTVTTISDNAFYDCESPVLMASITLPSTIISIGKLAFWKCKALTSFTIPSSVKTIGDNAFSHCTGLISVTIGDSVSAIGDFAFSDCTSLNNINIPSSVTTIGRFAFEQCSSLQNITIPNNVISIGDNAFYGCTRLNSITVMQEQPISITENVFTNRANATLYVPYGSKMVYEDADYWKDFKEIIEIEPEKCATPTISFANGLLKFNCETEDVEYVYNISITHSGKGNVVLLPGLSVTYSISVYAIRNGYIDSDVATYELGHQSQIGDANGDGTITISDAAVIVDIILGRNGGND